jgi:hypothetical protein
MKDIDEKLELVNLQEELWIVWCGYKKIPNEKIILPKNLSEKGLELLEAAIVGERITEVIVGINLQGVESTFNEYMKKIKPDKVFWMCQVFMESDGTLVSDANIIQFRNLLKTYCDEQSLNLGELEKQFINKVNSLPFYPVYDWLFAKEINENQITQKDLN